VWGELARLMGFMMHVALVDNVCMFGFTFDVPSVSVACWGLRPTSCQDSPSLAVPKHPAESAHVARGYII
jgi:hypothetical protein